MNLSFGIITSRQGIEQAAWSIYNIVQQNIPTYEIIVVGGGVDELKRWTENEELSNVKFVSFDENAKSKAWITRKKNLITEHAQYDTIVYLHDYFNLDKDWWKGWEHYTEDFDVAVNKIVNPNGTRHADWVIDSYLMWELIPESKDNYDVGLPYNVRGLTKIQYVSGGFWLAKKEFMKRFPLDEKLLWGEAEDIYWSREVREHTEFKINLNATTRLGKHGKWETKPIRQDWLSHMIKVKDLMISYENI